MMLRIKQAEQEDVYRDIVRVPEVHRLDSRGCIIPEGEVCKVTVANNSAFVIVRGKGDSKEIAAWMDERTRNRLALSLNSDGDLTLEVVGLWGQLRWAWASSDPAYRVSARLAVLSVVLGVIGLILGCWSLLK